MIQQTVCLAVKELANSYDGELVVGGDDRDDGEARGDADVPQHEEQPRDGVLLRAGAGLPVHLRGSIRQRCGSHIHAISENRPDSAPGGSPGIYWRKT